MTRLVILELEGAKDVTEWFDKSRAELEPIELVEKGLGRRRDERNSQYD